MASNPIDPGTRIIDNRYLRPGPKAHEMAMERVPGHLQDLQAVLAQQLAEMVEGRTELINALNDQYVGLVEKQSQAIAALAAETDRVVAEFTRQSEEIVTNRHAVVAELKSQNEELVEANASLNEGSNINMAAIVVAIVSVVLNVGMFMVALAALSKVH